MSHQESKALQEIIDLVGQLIQSEHVSDADRETLRLFEDYLLSLQRARLPFDKGGLMILDKKWIEEFKPCDDGLDWLEKHPTRDVAIVIADLLEFKKEWALWALPRVLNRRNRILYSCFASELCLSNYATFNVDTTPLMIAIASARAVAENDNEETRSAWSACRAWAGSASRSCPPRPRAQRRSKKDSPTASIG